MKYKVGDKVKIKSVKWYNANYMTIINTDGCFLFNKEMTQYCGKEATIMSVIENGPNIVPTLYYKLDIDDRLHNWQNYMFEDVAETTEDKDVKCLTLPEGWEFDKVEGNKVILKRHKEELPKTWEGCIAILVDNNRLDERTIAGDTPRLYVPKELSKPFKALSKLFVCREVYRRGWEPNWEDGENKYCIEYFKGRIIKSVYLYFSRTLSFQSEEVRDEFFENFRDLIEETKELI